MNILFFGVTLIAIYTTVLCQDIVFPNDEETSHVSGNKMMITERIPVSAVDRCPENMLLYPGDGMKSAWVCDCRPRFLYFPRNDSCHEAFRRGPCPSEHYVVLPTNQTVPECVRNPCREDGLVQFNNMCHPLRTIGGPCGKNTVLGVNETTFKLECIPADIATFHIIDPPKREKADGCPAGSRRSSLYMCRPQF